MTTDAPITQQEIAALDTFFKVHNIAWIGADGDKNGETIGNCLNQWADSTPTKQAIPITPKSLEIVFKQVQESLI